MRWETRCQFKFFPRISDTGDARPDTRAIKALKIAAMTKRFVVITRKVGVEPPKTCFVSTNATLFPVFTVVRPKMPGHRNVPLPCPEIFHAPNDGAVQRHTSGIERGRRTTTVPATLSCQPCFSRSQPIQKKPRKRITTEKAAASPRTSATRKVSGAPS